ncbi:type II secretion system minor pseudopilin GspI [Candidatus Thiodubiliella endoseptemdiera]|uniref:type II secretion system minor pseudopilin GspI n=1 Tax=Candidatus Thiodubiliella endoseptemdiera TaxID=2738886 RepID=UPI0034DFEAB2
MKQNIRKMGFTLIEVLVALSIVSIALIALIKLQSQSVKNLTYFKQKTLSNLVVSNLAVEKRLVKPALGFANGTYVLGKQTWHWKTHTKPTPNTKIIQVSISVFKDKVQLDAKNPLSALEIYVQK